MSTQLPPCDCTTDCGSDCDIAVGLVLPCENYLAQQAKKQKYATALALASSLAEAAATPGAVVVSKVQITAIHTALAFFEHWCRYPAARP